MKQFLKDTEDLIMPLLVVLTTLLLIIVVLNALHDEIKRVQKTGSNRTEAEIATYFFKDPKVVDPKINGTKELYITGELKLGRCRSDI